MTSYTKESNDLKGSVIQTKCKETQEETNEFMGEQVKYPNSTKIQLLTCIP